MGLLNENNNMQNLLRKLTMSAEGGNNGLGGRIGVDGVPLANNLTANFGASGYYMPEQNMGEFNAYDAALQYQMGKQKQHGLGFGINGYGTQNPQYMLNYEYKF